MGRRLQRFVGLTVVFLTLGMAGCEGATDLPSALDVPRPSTAREGVVVRNTPDYASFEMPRSWDFQRLLDFYDKEMPEGEDWEGWPYCGTRGGRKASDTYLTRLYRTDDDLQLEVSVLWGGMDAPLTGGVAQRTKLNPNPAPC